ncbi:ATP-binding cassette domain-containing protein [Gallaecimonas kandeliae]|uniref:ATP-binding cassette domain-containing protein n=1 Tax=Gallaecimonas kandeliae TaxID=3029055 RepID=UPI002648A81F|nr:ATP-binding cassette domain-containing protein [Gallaecimonas kandeliae]WKE66553.1 ATP-binding cassette domain-containing protein [Gallaecimonas kandeliae]
MTKLFSLDGGQLGYGNQAVFQNLSLAIQAGEKVALLGESGTGKSTLLRTLRAQRPSEVAWCPQQPGLVPMLSAWHNIYMGRLERHSFWYNLANLVRPQAAPRAEITALAEELGLEPGLLERSAASLSGGQQGRVSLGRALYQQKPVFMGDEPVSALDEVQSDAMLALICRRHQTVVLALHDTDMALRHCDRIIGLRQGQLVLDAPSKDLDTQRLQALYQS